MKAVKNFEEGKETTEVNPTEEQGDKAQKIKVNSSKTTISSKKKSRRLGRLRKTYTSFARSSTRNSSRHLGTCRCLRLV